MNADREINIYGQVYHVKAADDGRLDQVAGYVNEMMRNLLGGSGPGLSAKGAVLTALNIADEWFAYKDEADRAFGELNARVDELLSILPK